MKAAFDGGDIVSDDSVLLLRHVDVDSSNATAPHPSHLNGLSGFTGEISELDPWQA